MHTDTTQEIARLMGLVLGRAIAPGDAVAMRGDPVWDSMKHIEIILTLEEGLGVSFAPEDIPFLTSMELIAAKVKELHAA